MSSPASDQAPLRSLKDRPGDWLFVLAYAGFAASTFTVDLWAVTGRIHGDDPLALALRGYTGQFDPLFGAMPFYVWALMLISLVFFGPLDLLVVYAFLRGRAWIRTPALVGCGMQVACMLCYFIFEARGPYPPGSWPVVLAANGPYLLVPLLLVARLWRPDPFGPGRAG